MANKKFIVAEGRAISANDVTHEGGKIVDLDLENPETTGFIEGGYVRELTEAEEAAIKQNLPETPAAPIKSPLSDEMAPARDLSAEREARIVPVAKALLARISSHSDLLIGKGSGITEETLATYYQDLYVEDIIPAIFEADLYLIEIPYLFQMMMQVIQLASDVTTNSINQNREVANAKKWGVDDTDDIRVGDLQEALTGSRELIKPEEEEAPVVDKEEAQAE